MDAKVRILFVDDEPRVLDGLRRTMRARRHVWECNFAASGPEAQRVLAEAPHDVVVSDMRMPGMDGAELLRSVSELHPETIRIVLSGQMDDSAALRASRVAHRFLAKPCEGDVLDTTIQRALAVRGLLGSERLRRAVGGIGNLPVLSASAQAIHRIVSDENGTASDVAAIIEKDVAMAAKVLQLVNSAFFGVPRGITQVKQAVSYLGLNTIRNLVIAQSLFSQLAGDDDAAQRAEQGHALLASRFAPRLLADPFLAQSAGTAAMLHDIGALVLASRFPVERAAAIAEASHRGVFLHVVERERFGASHAEIGAYLLGLWGLSHEVIEAVAMHHAAPSEDDVLDVSLAVRIAIALATDPFEQTEFEAGGGHASEARLERFGLQAVAAQIHLERELVAAPHGAGGAA